MSFFSCHETNLYIKVGIAFVNTFVQINGIGREKERK